MPILNYTTKISHSKTVGEISECLSAHGARRIAVDYEDGLPMALAFCIELNAQDVFFQLPCRWKGVLSVMERDKKVPRNLCNKDQALRVSWRILKDWVEAQMAAVEAEIASIPEVFLPYALTANGQTVFEKISSNPKLLLN
jgi:hypothetical protein